MKEYTLNSVEEGAIGTLFLGASRLPLAKVESTLNKYAREGYEVAFQIVEQKRFLLFWTRESMLITLVREK